MCKDHVTETFVLLHVAIYHLLLLYTLLSLGISIKLYFVMWGPWILYVFKWCWTIEGCTGIIHCVLHCTYMIACHYYPVTLQNTCITFLFSADIIDVYQTAKRYDMANKNNSVAKKWRGQAKQRLKELIWDCGQAVCNGISTHLVICK